MIILIPLGGIGQRFKDSQYTEPKALVNVLGKPILYWLLDSLSCKKTNEQQSLADKTVFIVYNKEYVKFRLEDRIRNDYPGVNFKFLPLQHDTGGAADTVRIALEYLESFGNIDDSPILSLDGDNFYDIDIVSRWNGMNKVFTFISDNPNPIYSYVEVKPDQKKVFNIVEKMKISNYACTGAYGFASYKQLLKYCAHIVNNNIRDRNEFYISTAIRTMIENNISFDYEVVENDKYFCIGTPVQLRMFHDIYPQIGKQPIPKKRFCFDLDNTLTTFPVTPNDYTTTQPIENTIQYMRYLKQQGHTIIIHTARRMRTHSGNVGKVIADVGLDTMEILQKYNIPYDELYFGKPHAHYYIDDLAISAYSDLEKATGYYNHLIEPRSFNTLEQTTLEVYKKTTIPNSDKLLDGEIYYYLHIPPTIRHLFPALCGYDPKNMWYLMEKIKGIPFSKLYLAQNMTLGHLTKLIDQLSSIHQVNTMQLSSNSQSNIDDQVTTEALNVNIYENYAQKIEQRYKKHISIYDKFSVDKSFVDNLVSKLGKYEEQNMGKFAVIHGDPVFTNILFTNDEVIKFIDMRGKIGNTLTIYGDAMYDWAKVYQSLIGYDEILTDTIIPSTYKQTMIDHFLTLFTSSPIFDKYTDNDEKLKSLKLITQSLVVSLIPLHNNDKCTLYYKLLKSKWLL